MDEATTGTPRIDAHLHIWDLAVSEYSWLTPDLGELYATFTAEQAHAVLQSAGFDGAILVQAEDSPTDTRHLLDVAAAADWVAGVVGWVPLDDTAAAASSLDELVPNRALRGIRHLVHDDPRDDFLDLPAVRASLRLVAEHGLAFDVPNAWPRSLSGARRVAETTPELSVVIDHLAKPPVGTPEMGAWREELARVARSGNTVAKLSGLRLPSSRYDEGTIRPLVDTALEVFGVDRLMYGGDWPVSGPTRYLETWSVLNACLAELSTDEQAAIFGGTASRVYRL